MLEQQPNRCFRRPFAWVGCFAVASLLVLTIAAPTASADPSIYQFSVETSTNQAGGHPDVAIHAHFDNRESIEGKPIPPSPEGCQCGDPESFAAELPTGFIGNPRAIPLCTLAEFSLDECPVDSQVGLTEVEGAGRAPIYNLEPREGEAGLTGFIIPVLNTPAFTTIHARTGSDYGLDATTVGLFHLFPLGSIALYLWGVPALPSHDGLRFPADAHTCPGQVPPYPEPCLPPTPANSLPVPFLSNPTTCGVPLSAAFEVAYYSGQVARAETSVPATVGCDQLGFNPSLTAQPTTTAADTPSGLDVDVRVPQPQDATVPSPSEIRDLIVTLPKGFSLNPGASDGKESCADASLNFESEEAAQCPEFAKIGTVEIESAVLPAPLPGAIYIGQPHADHQFRTFITASGFGTHVKLRGDVTLDPKTGQIQQSFLNLPQTPLQDFRLHYFGSERGIFATPTTCGVYPVKAEFVPWDSLLSTQTSLSSFTIDSGLGGGPCPGTNRPFSPSFLAGTSDNTAGATSPLMVQVQRADGDQYLNRISTELPPGLIQSLRGVGECPQADLEALALASHTGLDELVSPACPASSQIGTLVSASGPGTRPIYNQGKIFLAGPYEGAPLSIVTAVPAVGGPYDLGNAVVRAAAFVNPETTQVKVVSDPVTSILSGVPVRLRSLLLDFERPGFVHLPTNCEGKAIAAQLEGDEGAVAEQSTHFQVANCANLPFAPKLSIGFTGSTKHAGNPGVRALVKYPKGGPYANIASTAVTLPPTELIDNAHLNDPCTRVQFAQGSTPGEKCPAGSLIGFAKAETPLLDRPLEGPVYLRSAPENKNGLPDIVAALNGQIDVVLDGKIATVKGNRLRTTFAAVPDAPVSKFTLSLDGGHKGLLETSANSLCAHPLHVSAKIVGQNGDSANQSPLLNVPCGKQHKKRYSHGTVSASRRAVG